MNSWKEIGPLEVSAWKSGAVDPKRKVVDIVISKVKEKKNVNLVKN